MKKQAVKICVIVPVYNVAPYLARCLDSLVFQTLRDIEIICVDDKSTDNSLEILREYEKKDPRIRVIALGQNGGVAAARNAGIAAARGEYLGFVDSDDYVDLDFFETLYNAAKESGADMARGNVKITQYDGTVFKDHHEIRDVQKKGKWHFSWQWWCAIYRTDMIKNACITFPSEISCGEDTVFLAKCINVANFVSVCKDTFYHYIRREDSLDEQVIGPIKLNDRIKALRTIAAIYNNAEMCSDDYVAMYGWVLGGLHSHFYKNTMLQCRKDVANAIIDLYKDCKNKSKLVIEMGRICGAAATVCIQSHDVVGLFDILSKSTVPAMTCQDRFYLFGLFPVWGTRKSQDRFLFKFLGIDVLKIKTSAIDFRLWILYLPIIRKKRKFI